MGLSICERLARRGNRGVVVGLGGPAAQLAAEKLRAEGADALACEVDVTDRPAIEEALGTVRARFGPVEILVTSAGLVAFDRFTDITPASWNRVIEVNLTGTFHCTQA